MTTRRHGTRRNPVLLVLALLAVLLALAAVQHLAEILVLAGLAGIALAAERRLRHRAPRPAARVIPGSVEPPEPPELTRMRVERDQLAARVGDLERQLDGARDAAHAAWDAAASAPPRPEPARDNDARARLLGDPLSGARPLGTRSVQHGIWHGPER